jgi:RNase P/RNase MRP subunit POP5
MAVKEKRGRRRYIAFTVSPHLTKESLITVFRRISDGQPYVIQCAEGWAVLRCSPDETDATISKMKDADPISVSLRTSGTLSKLREIYPELNRLRPPKRV